MDQLIPDSARVRVESQEQLAEELIGLRLHVKISAQGGKPIEGQAFQIHADEELIVKAITDESGEYRGQRVLSVKADTQRRVFLVLEGSSVSDWILVPQKPEEVEVEPFTVEYKRFGDQLCNLSRGEVAAYLGNYDSSQFNRQFRLLIDPSAIAEVIKNESSRGRAVNQLSEFLGTYGPWSKGELNAVIDGWIIKFEEAIPKESTIPGKMDVWKADLEKVRTTLQEGRILEQIYHGPVADPVWEDLYGNLCKDTVAVKKRLDVPEFQRQFVTLISITESYGREKERLSKDEKELIRRDIKNLFGKDVKEICELRILISKILPVMRGGQAVRGWDHQHPVVEFMDKLMRTLKQKQLDEIYS